MDAEREVKIGNPYGLHARAASRFAEVAKSFRSDITVTIAGGQERVSGRSILDLLALGAMKDDRIRIRARGEDAWVAVETLAELVQRGIDIDEDDAGMDEEDGEAGTDL